MQNDSVRVFAEPPRFQITVQPKWQVETNGAWGDYLQTGASKARLVLVYPHVIRFEFVVDTEAVVAAVREIQAESKVEAIVLTPTQWEKLAVEENFERHFQKEAIPAFIAGYPPVGLFLGVPLFVFED